MWIFCCGMPRSGSTVQYQITKELIENADRGFGIGFVKPNELGKVLTKYANYKGMIALKTHRMDPLIPELFEKNKALGIYIYRDIRDAVLSRMLKQNLTFEKRKILQFLNLNLSTYHQWCTLNPLLKSKYENMVKDLKGEVHRIAAAITINISEREAQCIGEKYSLERQKERIAKFDFEKNGIKTKAGIAVYDPDSQLHSNHINSGAVNQWCSGFTAEQIAIIEEEARDWLVSHGYKLNRPMID